MNSGFAQAPVIAMREDKKIFLPRGAALPPNCVKCGLPAEIPWKKKFHWHAPVLYVLVLFNLLIYFVIALIVRKSMEVNVPLCGTHHQERKRYNILAAIMLIGALPVGLLLGSMDLETMAWLGGFAMFFMGLGFYIVSSNYMRPAKIDEAHALLEGAKEPFLSLLPDRKQSSPLGNF